MADSVPIYVIGTAAVSAMMVATSVAISLTTEGDVADLLYLDCLATQNLGHAAFLVGFATSCWRGGHVLGSAGAHAALPEPALYAAALPEPALYAEGYTLAFHVAFVSAVGLACADAAEAPAAVIYGVGFVSASATTAATLAVDALAAPAPSSTPRAPASGPPRAAPRAAPGGRPEPRRRPRRRPRGPVVDLAALAAAAVPGAAAAWPLAVAHGATFVGQALLVAVAADPPGSRFDRGVNFAIHGAGIFVFNAYLMFSDARAFPRLRAISLPRDAHDRVAPPEKAPDREAPRTADPGPFRLGRAVRHQRSHFAPYWCACFLAFAAFAFLRRSSPDAHAPRRVLETPHAYLLGFHFVFILSGFAAHGLRTRVVASLRVASAFLAAAGVVAAAQLVLAPPALVAALAACVAAGELRALVETRRRRGRGRRAGRRGELWQCTWELRCGVPPT
ncbi:high-affinity potassium ion transmembrane transporter [Aureococcus anophagefferens]|nr:high-affinity potassium ion transmembrane transporter [Aureococcus anophagefferens]